MVRPALPDLAVLYARAAARRAEAHRLATAGDPRGALDLVELGLWDEMAKLRPFDAPIVEWRDCADEIVPGVQVRQIWAEVAANWVVRTSGSAAERHETMLLARERLEQAGTTHPVLLDELAWLYEEVEPKDEEHARQIRVHVRDQLTTSPPLEDGGRQAYRLRIHSELVEDIANAWQVLDRASDETIDGPIARIDAINSWIKIWDKGRGPPRLDVPISERKGMVGERVGGGRSPGTASDPVLAHETLACDIAHRCGDAGFEAEVCWAAAQWGDAHLRHIPSPIIATWASCAERGFALGEGDPRSSQAAALNLVHTPITTTTSHDTCSELLRRADKALVAIGGNLPIWTTRLQAIRGTLLDHLGSTNEAAEAFAMSFAALQKLAAGLDQREADQVRALASRWLDLARAAAGVRADSAAIHDIATRAYGEAGDAFSKGYDPRSCAIAYREGARLIWNDGDALRQEAIQAYHLAVAKFGELGASGSEEQETTLVELAEHLRASGDEDGSLVAILDAADAWRSRSKSPDDAAAQRAATLERRTGLRPEQVEPLPDAGLDRTQGPYASVLSRCIAGLGQGEVRARRAKRELLMRLVRWPGGDYLLTADQQADMRLRWHLGSADMRALAASALELDDFFLIQIIDTIGHRPVTPVLAETLRHAERKEFGSAAEMAFRVIMREDPAVATELIPRAIDLTWGDHCTAVIGLAAKLLSAERFAALCRDLVIQSQGENRGILADLINIVARDPTALPLEQLRRFSTDAVWYRDQVEAMWALALVQDPSLSEIVPRILESPNSSIGAWSEAMQLACVLRLRAAIPAIQRIIADDDADKPTSFLQSTALIAAVAMQVPLDDTLVARWATRPRDEQAQTATEELLRMRTQSACLVRWLNVGDQAAWAVLTKAMSEGDRCMIIEEAGESGHPRAFSAIMDIAKDDPDLANPENHSAQEQSLRYLRALSRLPLDDVQRAQVEQRFGRPVPPPAPPISPNFFGSHAGPQTA